MPKNLIVVDEIYEYPVTGDNNYGEEATGWAEAATSVLAQISGPGDIPTTETNLLGISSGGYVTGDITNLSFDTAYVQSIIITGHITRTYTDATPTQVEAFSIEGVYNGTEINFSTDLSGDDTELEFDVNGGQFRFKYLEIAGTDTVVAKFSAAAKVDESYFA
jgi:hypothetical protein